MNQKEIPCCTDYPRCFCEEQKKRQDDWDEEEANDKSYTED